jgi:hypothetical protein
LIYLSTYVGSYLPVWQDVSPGAIHLSRWELLLKMKLASRTAQHWRLPAQQDNLFNFIGLTIQVKGTVVHVLNYAPTMMTYGGVEVYLYYY